VAVETGPCFAHARRVYCPYLKGLMQGPGYVTGVESPFSSSSKVDSDYDEGLPVIVFI
jgi:hypothetical protein